MTVKELIDKLSLLPNQDATVIATLKSNGSYPDDERDIDDEFFEYRQYDNKLSIGEF